MRIVAIVMFVSSLAAPANAQTTVSVNVNSVRAVMPYEGRGIHSSVYDNSLQYTGSPVFEQLNDRLDAAGVTTLRYPGGGYADVFHWSVSRQVWQGGPTGHGLTPWWGEPENFGYMGPNADFGNFVKLLDATQSQSIITVNSGGAMRWASANQLGVPTHGGQPQEAAAWVAYANGNANLFGTPIDISLGVDAEGNNWKTVGYWAKLRGSTPAEFQTWATAAGLYDSRNAFLAIDRDAPVGIKYWEIGNETFGAGYYGGGNQYALNYAVPYDGTNRDDHPALSPAAYGQQVNTFVTAMKTVDPTIRVGAVLATPPGDYGWSYADLNDNGVKEANEPYWNDEVLAQSANNIEFVSVHWYPSGSNSQILAAPRTTIPAMIHGTTSGLDSGSNAGLRDSIARWRTDGNGNALEILVTETDGGGSNQAVDGLFAADMYSTFLENGVRSVNWLELHQGGFLSESSNEPDYAYFGIQMVHHLAQPGDELVAANSSNNNIRAHAAVQQDGTVAVLIINTGTGSATINVSIDGDVLLPFGVRYSTNGDSALTLTEMTSGLGNNFSVSIPGRNMYLYHLTAAKGGDFDLDGDVDGADFVAWQSNFPKATGATWAQGDADRDGDVDGADFVIWQTNFPLSPAPSAAPVPEPDAAWLAMIALPLLLSLPTLAWRTRRSAARRSADASAQSASHANTAAGR
jgi:hypothetical protein